MPVLSIHLTHGLLLVADARGERYSLLPLAESTGVYNSRIAVGLSWVQGSFPFSRLCYNKQRGWSLCFQLFRLCLGAEPSWARHRMRDTVEGLVESAVWRHMYPELGTYWTHDQTGPTLTVELIGPILRKYLWSCSGRPCVSCQGAILTDRGQTCSLSVS